LNFATSLGLDVAIKTGVSVTFANSRAYSYTKGGSFAKAAQFDNEASHFVRLKVDPTKAKVGFLDVTMPKFAAPIALASSAVAAAITVAGKLTGLASDKDGKDIVNGLATAHSLVTTAGGVALLAAVLKENPPTEFGKTKTAQPDGTPASDFFMNEYSAYLHVTGENKGPTSITLKAGENFGDTTPAELKLVRTSSGSKIGLKAGKAGDPIGNTHLLLEAGSSSIKMTDRSIVFKCAGETFTIDENGLTLAKKDLSLTAGSIKKVKEITASGKIKTDGDIKGKKLTYTGLDGPCKVG
jgi:hypothetical protein